MTEEFIPDWDLKEPQPGKYIWTVQIWEVELPPNPKAEKPYVTLFYHVTDGEWTDFKNSFKLYLNPKAKSWALYFLRKFGYPNELLEGIRPVIRRTALLGLVGKILVDVFIEDGGTKFDVKGFERVDETELEKRIAPKAEEVPFQPDEPIPTMDINADAAPAEDLSFLEGISTDVPEPVEDDNPIPF